VSRLKIGVISDSHGMYKYIDLAMEHLKDVDLIIHAGDNYKDAKYIEKNYNIKVVAVFGNCDIGGIDERIELIGGKKIFITHGHNYGVKMNINGIFYAGKQNDADIVIFGHSHTPFYAVEEGMVLLNPGSTSLPRGGSEKSCCIITIEEDIKVDFINI